MFWTLLIICYIKTTNNRSSVFWLSFYCCFIFIINLIKFDMNLSPHNIQRITKWIQNEVDYNFLNPGNTYAF